MAEFVQQLVNGITAGSVYALIALGYTMVYGIIQLINFAHGEIFMVGAFAGLARPLVFVLPETLATNAWVALAAVMLVAAIARGRSSSAVSHRARRLPAAAQRAAPGAAHHRHRRVDLPAGGRPPFYPGGNRRRRSRA